MRKDIEECGAEIYRKGFPWGMVTNALHLTPERYQRLLASGMHSMAISLDGLKKIITGCVATRIVFAWFLKP